MLIKKYIYSSKEEFASALAKEAMIFAKSITKSSSSEFGEKDAEIEAFEKKCRELCEGGCGLVRENVTGRPSGACSVSDADGAFVLRELLSYCRSEANLRRLIGIYNLKANERAKGETFALEKLSASLFALSNEKDPDRKASLALSLCEDCDKASEEARKRIKSLILESKSTVDMLIEKDVIEEYVSCFEKISRCALFASVSCK